MKQENLMKLKVWCVSSGHNQNSLAKATGVSQPYIGNLLNGAKNFGARTAKAWEDAFGINSKWLMYDEEPMMLSDLNKDDSDENMSEALDLLREKMAIEDRKKPVVPSDLVRRQDADLWKRITDERDSCEMVSAGGMLPDHDAFHRVMTDAMEPNIQKGDMLAIKRLDDPTSVIQGECYLVDTKSRGLLLRNVTLSKGSFVCSSPSPSYPDTEVRMDEVNGVFSIVGVLRLHVSSKSSEADMRRELERKNSQIDELISQQDRLIGIMEGR